MSSEATALSPPPPAFYPTFTSKRYKSCKHGADYSQDHPLYPVKQLVVQIFNTSVVNTAAIVYNVPHLVHSLQPLGIYVPKPRPYIYIYSSTCRGHLLNLPPRSHPIFTSNTIEQQTSCYTVTHHVHLSKPLICYVHGDCQIFPPFRIFSTCHGHVTFNNKKIILILTSVP